MNLFKNNALQSEEKELKRQIKEFQEIYGDILDWIITDLGDLEKLGYSISLIKVSNEYLPPYFDSNDMLGYDIRSFGYDSRVIWSTDAKKIKKLKDKILLRRLAYKNLARWTSQAAITGLITGIFEKFHSSFLEYTKFQQTYFLLERLYFLKIGHRLGFQDLLNVYFSDLDTHLTFALDKFDQITYVPEPTANFFKKMDQLDYPEKEPHAFFYKSRKIIRTALSLAYGKYGYFGTIEEDFLEYLAGCSAIKNDRDTITIDDFVTAYKTYYKLLKTDVSQYMAKEETLDQLGLEVLNGDVGYLICNECNSYYKLEPGESPDDFDKCQCGGELEYVEKIDNE